MTSSYQLLSALVLACFFFISCEDKELVKKNEELRVKLNETKKQADLMEINAGEDPGDQSGEIAKVNEDLTNTLNKLKELDQQKEAVEEKQRVLEEELRAYQKKYRIQ